MEKVNSLNFIVGCLFSEYLFLKTTSFLQNRIQWYSKFDRVVSTILHNDIYIATNGSVKTNTANSAWIACDMNKVWLMSNTGLSNGYDCYSYQSESMAMISILYFPQYFWFFINKQYATGVTVFTHSDSFPKGYNRFQYHFKIGDTLMNQYVCAE